jgi:seryl-tRNA synthetase
MCEPALWLQAKEDASALRERSTALKEEVAAAQAEEAEVAEARDAAVLPIGNLVHDSVPVSDDEVRRSPELVT